MPRRLGWRSALDEIWSAFQIAWHGLPSEQTTAEALGIDGRLLTPPETPGGTPAGTPAGTPPGTPRATPPGTPRATPPGTPRASQQQRRGSVALSPAQMVATAGRRSSIVPMAIDDGPPSDDTASGDVIAAASASTDVTVWLRSLNVLDEAALGPVIEEMKDMRLATVADVIETLEEKDDLELFLTDEGAIDAIWASVRLEIGAICVLGQLGLSLIFCLQFGRCVLTPSSSPPLLVPALLETWVWIFGCWVVQTDAGNFCGVSGVLSASWRYTVRVASQHGTCNAPNA
eukprot:SAG11_NODE_4573_length_1846_cov_0.831712_1_plen_288_part_00